MIDWSQPRSLSKVTEDAGFTMSDVAFVSGLDESTVSRLWDDPDGLIASAAGHCNPWLRRFPESQSISHHIPCWHDETVWLSNSKQRAW